MISIPDALWEAQQVNCLGVDVPGSDGLTYRQRNRMAREHHAAMRAPFSASEKRALEAAALRREGATP